MSKKPLNISEEAAVQMPMKTVASLIIIVALGTMGYFQMVERLNIADTRIQIMEKDLAENTEFRIKWPRGQLGALPADSEQFMMIEDLYKTTDKLNKHSTTLELMQKDLEANSEFRIKYPRGELGQSSGEAELFMLVEHMAGLIESMDEELKGMRNNKINIDFLKEQVSKLQEDVEKLIRNGSEH